MLNCMIYALTLLSRLALPLVIVFIYFHFMSQVMWVEWGFLGS